jgi:hypothetical protein
MYRQGSSESSTVQFTGRKSRVDGQKKIHCKFRVNSFLTDCSRQVRFGSGWHFLFLPHLPLSDGSILCGRDAGYAEVVLHTKAERSRDYLG